ncbi:MAG: PTS galactitol transporter subunit IIC [Hespellia sp.]|jgi:PTS system galactitol-specific IIC component|nr:PTS galactitol transporter subunit IIC [Hespellia sp.]
MVNIVLTILGMGATVIMPFVFTILGIVFGMKMKEAIRSGITVGIGFTGINLALGLISNNLGEIVPALSERWHLSLTITDVGWPAASGIAFGSGTFVATSILVYLTVNAIFLLLKWTHTLNLDIFNMWHFILIGMLTYVATDKYWIGITAGTVMMMVNTITAERQENVICDFAGEQWRGLTFSTQGLPAQLYFSRGCNWVLDHIPGLNKIYFNLNELPASVSFFAEPAILGLILGCIISTLAGYGWQDIISVGMSMAAAMYLLPKMVGIMMEGLSTITDAAREFMAKRFSGRQFNLAMDYCMLMGEKEVITMGLLFIPIVLLLAVILPGNQFLPFTDLPSLAYWCIGPVYGCKHNSFRSIIVTLFSMILALYMVTNLAPLFTTAAIQSGFAVASGQTVGGLCLGFEWFGYLIHKIFAFIF